jgi:phenylacetate-CoA ligase
MFSYVNVQDFIIRRLTKWSMSHRILLSPGIENYRWKIGRWRAWRTFNKAKRRVPAYGEFLEKHHSGEPVYDKRVVNLQRVSPMDKKSYILPYSAVSRCLGGRLPARGVLVDESSGSSGHPTSWVRGKQERVIVREVIQVVFSELTQDQPVFIINAFAMGAWATGMATTMALIDKYIVKSTGPDLKKIIETLEFFGPNYRYVIFGYPPFLKDLADNPSISLSAYNIMAIYGGEAMSESMRDYLLKKFQYVVGSYGASDLEINMAAENEFTITLRKALLENDALRQEITKTEYGVLPMIFQYNPFEYIFETNEKGELLATICRATNINPRIRYNIHDLGHVIRLRELKPILKKHGLDKLMKARQLDFPLLFHYGRSDLSLDFYGAVVSPESIRQVLFANPKFAKILHTFRLITYEDKSAHKQLLFAIELKENIPHQPADVEKAMQEQIIEYLKVHNLDFAAAYLVAERTGSTPKTKVYPYDQGVFKRVGPQKLKDEYIWSLSYEAAIARGLLKSRG